MMDVRVNHVENGNYMLNINIKLDPQTGKVLNEAELLNAGMPVSLLRKLNNQDESEPRTQVFVSSKVDVRDRQLKEMKARRTEKATLGVKSFVKAVLSGEVQPDEVERRKQICQQCDAKDEQGNLLLREIDGKVYCGEPRLRRILRSEAKSGCGCKLTTKWVFRESHCPLGKW